MDKTAMAVRVYDKYANSNQEKFMNFSLYHDMPMFSSCDWRQVHRFWTWPNRPDVPSVDMVIAAT